MFPDILNVLCGLIFILGCSIVGESGLISEYSLGPFACFLFSPWQPKDTIFSLEV